MTTISDTTKGPARRPALMYVISIVFLVLSAAALLHIWTALFPPEYLTFPRDRISRIVEPLLWDLSRVLFLFTMLLTTAAPLLEYVAKVHFSSAVEGRKRLLRFGLGDFKRIPIPVISSFPLITGVWWTACLIGLPLSIVGVLCVAIWEPGTVSRGLGTWIKDFDASMLIPMFLLIPAQQLGAGYLATIARAIPARPCPEKRERCFQLAFGLSFVVFTCNLVGIILYIVGLFFAAATLEALSAILFFTFIFFVIAAGLYCDSQRKAASIMEELG